LSGDETGRRRNTAAGLAMLPAVVLLVACADTGGPQTQRRQITSCPVGEVLVCRSNQPASKGGEEEIPLYEHCICKSGI
jgi:hypothetical protein